MRFDAVILSGGRAQRLGGVRKDAVEVAGRPMLDHVLEAVAGAEVRVVVGPVPSSGSAADLGSEVRYTLESPPLGGPVAGIAAGLAEAADAARPAHGMGPAPVVVVLSCDVPRVGRLVPALVAAAAGPQTDGAWAVDGEGRGQPLVAAFRHQALATRLARLAASGGTRNAPARRVIDGLRMVGLPDLDGAAEDADTWEAVAEVEARLASERTGGEP